MKTKVFYLVYDLESGGIEKYSINLHKYIDHTRFELDFITRIDRSEFFDEELLKDGGKKYPLVSSHDTGISKLIHQWKSLFKLLKHGHYQVAYFNLSAPSAVFKYPLICHFFGIKNIIIHSHNSSESKNGTLNKILNASGRQVIKKIATYKLACSDKAAEWMFGKSAVSKNDYIRINNGIETNKYIFNAETRMKVRQQLSIPNDALVIGHIGRFEYQKNHKFVIEIFNQIQKINTNAYLLLIGVGDLQSKIKEMVNIAAISKHVIFLGERTDIPELLQAMDIFLLPSHFEGLPVVGIEAQASGLLCYFSDVITNEADITGNVRYLSLNQSAETWAKDILHNSKYERNNEYKKIVDTGYDAKMTAKKIESILQSFEMKE